MDARYGTVQPIEDATPGSAPRPEAAPARLSTITRQALSARHVPNDIFQVAAVARTLSGKKMELPVKKLLLGAAAARVVNRDAMANAESIDWFVNFAAQRKAL